MPLLPLTLLLICQLIGEVVSRGLALPVPGPVIGMALLFVGLLARGRVGSGMQATAVAILPHLGLLFVPAGVGVLTHVALLSAEWRPIAAAVVGSTLLAIAATGLVLRAMARQLR
jgi:holin-like protein